MFYFSKFIVGVHEVILSFPEENHAEALFAAITHDRETLSRFMPWSATTLTVSDERQFIRYARAQNAKYDLLVLTVLVDGLPVGMVDLHDINHVNHTAKIGYWLSTAVQGQGIITHAVSHLVAIACDKLSLHKIILEADSENNKSIAVANRLGFAFEAKLKDQIYYHGVYKDLNIYVQFNPSTSANN
ncbi:GNAT family N-acetyltransferase [Leuconostoc gelidum subsp. gasicomitatum]|uniref:GNAT family N-acetyltransferase n=1 Tax=Leuconostoc gasicomitatum TaxID=115778 RepID=UPI001CC64C6F|nr:GNAT family protein [Leuconostoc gasicomitatum]MBZ5984375.1 GNAT family N-acetyltransferase [Leuconostoc gasicomitatum]